MDAIEQQAKDSLAQLVAHVFENQRKLIKGLTYQEVAQRIGRLTKHGEGHAHGMGQVLGVMGRFLKQVEDDWKQPIPEIQSLVVSKTGTNCGLPDDGIKEFWPDYPLMTRPEKEDRTHIEHQRIMDFGSRWNEVLKKLAIPLPPQITTPRVFGKGGESDAHKKLKEYVSLHPELVGAGPDWKAIVEYPLGSLDAVDVVFKSATACIAVEVKSVISDAYPDDYRRGIYQIIKYQALLDAMAQDPRYDIPQEIRSVLLLQSRLPDSYRALSKKLDIEILENVQIN